jgi:RNA polymerase sigma-70 factor (ECF subfamily)
MESSDFASKGAVFHTTRWSLVARAGDLQRADAQQSLSELCRIYWYPLYAFVRRRGSDPNSAADLIQGFFVELLEGSLLHSADRAKGKFRSYLLGALKHYLANEWQRAHRQKRGGKTPIASLDDAEQRYGMEPSHSVSPEHLYERRWALTLLQQANDQLRGQYANGGKLAQYEELKDLIAGPLADRSYSQIGEKLGMSEDAVKKAVQRMRIHYREILKAHIADTVQTPDDIDDELRHLYHAIQG